MLTVYVDRFSSADHLKGKARTYGAVKAAVLAAGRFSAFEAGEDPWFFDRLGRDPDIDTFDMGFPWVGVKRRPFDPR